MHSDGIFSLGPGFWVFPINDGWKSIQIFDDFHNWKSNIIVSHRIFSWILKIIKKYGGQ
jgi:hypothetical protein